MKQKKTPYVQWIHPKDDFFIPDGYSCVPAPIGHLEDEWAIFKTPHTPEEMDVAISIEESRLEKELEFYAHGGNVPPETRIGLLLTMGTRNMKRMGKLYERKGELKFTSDLADIKQFLGNEFLLWRRYIKGITEWDKSKAPNPPPRPPKIAANVRASFKQKWLEFRKSVKGISRPTAEAFFHSELLIMPIDANGHSLAEYYTSVDEIKAELHALNQNERNAKKKASTKSKRPAKRIEKATQKQKSRP